MNRHSQKGSALLIVLGFLSFMVVSAVAFAIWMRNERLPSSALRRNVANRYLVKAALAQAMSRVDDAIRSHAYPGAWYTNDQSKVYRDVNGCAYDWWESRVFMPPDPEGVGTTSGDQYSRYAPVTKTVSVLNLEALGYLPPAIANDVRLLARSSWAAQWDYFNFDAGRYAFCAVNVSDFLDISKMAADAPRTSAAAAHASAIGGKPPSSRFSLAYLLRTSTDPQNDNFSSVNGLSHFDQFVHTSPGQGGEEGWPSAPLVSLMDYNLSVGETKMGNLWSPFVDLASGFNNMRFFYEVGKVPNSPKIKGAERQPFVTASWFPPSDSTFAKSDGTSSTPLDLSQHQPFQPGTLLAGNHNMEYTQTAENKVFWETMKDHGHAFCDLDQCTLLDYLDEDNIPLSLAMPCAERVPMITALAPVGNVQVEFEAPGATPNETVNESPTVRKKYYDTKMKISFSGMGMSSTLIFPFKDRKALVGCTAQAFARLVFVGELTAGAGGGGAAGASVTLRNNGFARNFRPLSDAEWVAEVTQENQFKLEEGSRQGYLTHTKAENCMLVTLPGQDAFWDVDVMGKAQCWTDLQLPLKSDPSLERTIIRKIEIYKVTPATQNQPEQETLSDTKYQIVLKPFDAEGKVIEIPDGELEQTAFDEWRDKYTIRPYLVTWARVVQESKTVDMVPASYEDDKAFNGIDNNIVADVPQISPPLGNTDVVSLRENDLKMPIMRFPGTLSFTYTDANSGAFGQQNNQWAVKSCYAVDPRFNWAPENWYFDSSDANPTGQKWQEAVFKDGGVLDQLVINEFGSDYERADRANDPFLFVSNLGYLQSVGELAFLPRLSDMWESGVPNPILGVKDKENPSSPDYTYLRDHVYDGTPRDLTTIATMPCALAAWKSYQNFRTNPKEDMFEFGANLYRRGLVNGSQGFYINPYTQSQEVMLAALANTPLNYWVAGTNYTAQGQGKTEFTTFNSFKNYMFSESGTAHGTSRMTGRDINKVATFLRHRFEDLASMIEYTSLDNSKERYVYLKVWEDMFDALDWSGMLDCTVWEVYRDLQLYYARTEVNSSVNSYERMYKSNVKNGFPELNRMYMFGGNQTGGAVTSIRLNPEKAVHKEEFNLKADPLRGQYAGNTVDTSCYNSLHDVDRKFLHSYWRDCFGNRQQLFLIFVRAESTALGGTGEGTPAQQGGRAVALVWRDPMAPEQADIQEREDNQYQPIRHPHKMRVLFYRQLD